MPMLRLLFLALCLCLAPCTPRADGLFIVDDDLITGIRPGLPMRIVPTTDRNQPDPRVDAHAPLIYLDRDVQKAAALREKALNGDMEALLHLAVLSRVGEEEKQSPLFGAPAAFWEDWAARMLGGREAWFRLAVICHEFKKGSCLLSYEESEARPAGKASSIAKAPLNRLTLVYLRKAAASGHAEAMYALSRLCRAYPDKDFRMPKEPGFLIVPDENPESDYWLGAAAAAGSARACFALSLSVQNERDTLELLKKSMRLGFAHAAEILQELYRPCPETEPLPPDGTDKPNGYAQILHLKLRGPTGPNGSLHLRTIRSLPPCDNGKESIYYQAIRVRMYGEDGAEVADTAEQMMRGGNAAFSTACLTREEYEEAMRQAKKDFQRIEADLREKKLARDALYARAKPMFAEMRAAFAAQAKERAAPVEKSAAN